MNINQLLIKLAATETQQQATDKGELFNNFEKNKHGGSLANVVDNKLKQKDPKAYRKQLLENLKAKVGLNKMANVPPNINLTKRPKVKLNDGRIATVLSQSFNIDGKEVLLPTIVNGKRVSSKEAIDHYLKTGEHLGIYDSIEEANQAGQRIHKEEEKRIKNK